MSNGNKKVIDTSNGNFEQELLSNQTIPVVVLKMNLRIDQRIVLIVVATKRHLVPAAK